MRRAGAAILVAAAVVSCRADETMVAAGTRLAIGTWGGDGAGIIATDTVTHVHVGCTLGDIPGRVTLDANGRFTANGTYVLRAFPVFIGPTLPAQFSGVVVGRTLTFAVAVNDTVEKRVVALGPVTVQLGAEPRLGPCPICRVPGMRIAAVVASPTQPVAPGPAAVAARPGL